MVAFIAGASGSASSGGSGSNPPSDPERAADGDYGTASTWGAGVTGGGLIYCEWEVVCPPGYRVTRIETRWGDYGASDSTVRVNGADVTDDFYLDPSWHWGPGNNVAALDVDVTSPTVTIRMESVHPPGLSYFSGGDVYEVAFFGEPGEGGGGDPDPEPDPPIIDVADPEGQPITTLDNPLDWKVRIELNAAGSGTVTVDRRDPQATAVNFARGNIVRLTVPQISAYPIAEWVMEEGDFDLISSDEEGGEELRFGGPGSLAVLHRAVIWRENFVATDAYVEASKARWHFTDQSAGAIAARHLAEAVARGALSYVTRGWSTFKDSADIDWDPIMESWISPMGSYLDDELARLITADNLVIRMDPGLLCELYQTYGADLTGSSFGTGVVRFVKGVNIADEMGGVQAGQQYGSVMLMKRADGVLQVQGSGGSPPYRIERYMEVNTQSSAVAAKAALRVLNDRDQAQEGYLFQHATLNPPDQTDEANGFYLPCLPSAPDKPDGTYWIGDYVTLDTGNELYGDVDNETQRVYAITLFQDEIGHLAPPLVELNAPWSKGAGAVPTSAQTTIGGSGGGGSAPPSGGAGGGGGSSGSMGAYQPLTEKSQADGYASLGSTGLVPYEELGDAGDGSGTNVLHDNGTWAPEAGVGAGMLGWYNVVDYGAVGDGTTDDTTAIEDALDAADATGGGIIYFPPTTDYYKITSLITRTGRGYHLFGGGTRHSVRIHQATSNTGAFKFAPVSELLERTTAPVIENLVISGAGGASSGRGIESENDIHIERCLVYGFYDGVYIGTASYYSYIAHSTFTDCDHAGVRAVDSNNFTIDTCRFTGIPFGGLTPLDALAYGIYIQSASPAGYAMRIVNSSVEYFTQDGIYVDGGGSVDIIGCWFESSQSSSGHAYINLGPGSNTVRAALIAGCHFEGPGVSGFQAIKTDRASYVTIESNEDTTGFGALSVLVSSTANGSRFLLLNNAWGTGSVTLPANSYTLDPAAPPLTSGDAAGGDLGGTFPNPTVTDDSHNHTAATLPVSSAGGQLLISSVPSNPIVFGDVILTSDGTDFLYSS